MQQGCFHSVITSTSFLRPSWHTLAIHNSMRCLLGRQSGGWRCGLTVDSCRLHYLGACPVRIEQVCLPLTVLADVDFDLASVLLHVARGLQGRHRRCDIGNYKAEVMRYSPLRGCRFWLRQHELHIVITVWSLQVDPGKNGSRGTTAPRLLEPEHLG